MPHVTIPGPLQVPPLSIMPPPNGNGQMIQYPGHVQTPQDVGQNNSNGSSFFKPQQENVVAKV